MKIGAIIRSVGERTERLCRESLLQSLSVENVKIVKNVFPFLSTLNACYHIAVEERFDWYLLVDADMVMIKDWKKVFDITLNELKDRERLWEFTFRLKDGIEGRDIDALHVVNGRYSKELIKSVSTVIDGLKPEGMVRDNMMKRTGAKRVITKNVLAFHGYEQYKRDIFNRFYNRACRDATYANRFKLFREVSTEDKKVAKAGWDYGIKNSNLKSLDSRDKVEVKQFGFKELSYIRFGLETFYKKVG